MNAIMRNRKLRIFGFWILFVILTALMMETETFSIPIKYFIFAFGILLIGNCVYSVQGRIKRGTYSLSLFAFLFILLITEIIFLQMGFFVTFPMYIFFFITSYFLASHIFVLSVTPEIINLIMLDIEKLPAFIYPLILSFLFLACIYPFIVLNIKRLRDIKLSGWFSLLLLIPYISFLFVIFLCLKGSLKRPRKKVKPT